MSNIDAQNINEALQNTTAVFLCHKPIWAGRLHCASLNYFHYMHFKKSQTDGILKLEEYDWCLTYVHTSIESYFTTKCDDCGVLCMMYVCY